MAKTKLTAGSEIDFLTKDELDEVFKRYLSGFLRPPQTVRPTFGILLDSSGESTTAGALAGPADLFEVPAGYLLRLHRAGFWPDGYTLGAPYTSVTGYLNICRNRVAEDGIPLTSPGLPQIWTAGTADGIEYRNGEVVQVQIVDGPPSASVRCALQGTLEPVVTE